MINNKWVLLIVFFVAILFSGCRRGEEEILDSKGEDRHIEDEAPEDRDGTIDQKEDDERAGEDESGESDEETGETEENNEAEDLRRIEDGIADPGNWIRFNESVFHALITYRKHENTRLTYDDLYRDIDYRLMMEEEKVLELFGQPNQRVEDPYAYKMYILEYEGLVIHTNDYDHGVYATGYYIRSPEFPGPRGTKVGQSLGEVLLAYPLPEDEEYTMAAGQIHWGEETDYYGAHMAAIHHRENGEITELRYAEGTGFAGVAYEIFEGVVQSIYFFEMN